MLLVIDSGNTHVVFCLYEGHQIRGTWRIHEDPKRTSDELSVIVLQLLHNAGFSHQNIADVVIASVVPDTQHALITMVENAFQKKPYVVGTPSMNLGLDVLIDNPESVGADRVVNAVAGFTFYGGPLMIVDFGTATTIDVVDPKGNYRGGIIAPGVHLARQALYQAAAKLPPVPFARTEGIMGATTVSAVQSGCYWGYVGMIEGLLSRLQRENNALFGGAKAQTVATGGLSSIFSQDLDCIDHVRVGLTLEGLRLLYERNKEKAL